MDTNRWKRDPLAERPKTLLTILVGIAVGIVGTSAAGWLWAGSPRLDLAQWLPAVTGVATLLAAIAAAVYTAGAFRIETDREDRVLETLRRSQADLIAAWPHGFAYLELGKSAGSLNVRTSYDVQVLNGSPLPIYDVFIEVGVDLTPPADSHPPFFIQVVDAPTVIPPGDRAKVFLEPHAVLGLHDPELRARIEAELAMGRQLTPPLDIKVDLQFRDASGTRWLRRSNGDLYETGRHHDC